MQLHELSALDLAATLRRGEVSAKEVLEHTLERVRTAGAAVGAFAHVTPCLLYTSPSPRD